MAYIKKIANNKWQATISCGFYLDGKRHREYITADSERECKRAAAKLELEIGDKSFSNVEKMKFITYSRKWLKLVEPGVEESTFISYQMYVEKHFIESFGKFQLDKINKLMVQEYVLNKLKTLSASTVRKHFFVLRKMLDDALGLASPFLGLKPPSPSIYKVRIPTEEEFLMFHAVVNKSLVDEIILLLAGWCGLRQGEIFALKPNDILFQTNEIVIDESRGITKSLGYKDKSPKSQNGIRTIAADDYLMNLIKSYLKSLKIVPERLFITRPDSYSKRFAKIINKHNSVIDNPDLLNKADNRTKNSIIKNINVLDKKLPVIRFHDLRHYHATELYSKGFSDQYAAQRLGHDIMVLKKIYQHLKESTKEKEDSRIKSMHKNNKF